MGPRDQVGGATPHVDSRHPAGSGVDSHRGHVHRFQPHHRLAGARGPAVWNGWLWARSITHRSSRRWRASRQRWSRTWLECAAPDRTTRFSAHRADGSRAAVAGLESRQRNDDEGQSIGARRRCVRRPVVDGPDRADGETGNTTYLWYFPPDRRRSVTGLITFPGTPACVPELHARVRAPRRLSFPWESCGSCRRPARRLLLLQIARSNRVAA